MVTRIEPDATPESCTQRPYAVAFGPVFCRGI